LGGYLEWTGINASRINTPGGASIEADGLGFNGKNDAASTAGDL